MRPRCRSVAAVSFVLMLTLPQQLLQADVHDQPEPERLEAVEDEARLAVEDSQQEEVAVEKVQGRPHEQRHAVVAVFQPEDPLVWSAEEPRRGLPREVAAAAVELFLGECLGIAEVLLEVEEDRVLLQVPLLQRGAQAADGAADVDAGVLLDGIELGAAAAEELEQHLAAVAAEAQGLAAEDLPAADVEAVLPHVRAGEERR